MKRRLNHNRPICSGDQPRGEKMSFEALSSVLERIQNSSTTSLKKIYYTYSNECWRKAAKLTLLERGVNVD